MLANQKHFYAVLLLTKYYKIIVSSLHLFLSLPLPLALSLSPSIPPSCCFGYIFGFFSPDHKILIFSKYQKEVGLFGCFSSLRQGLSLCHASWAGSSVAQSGLKLRLLEILLLQSSKGWNYRCKSPCLMEVPSSKLAEVNMVI